MMAANMRAHPISSRPLSPSWSNSQPHRALNTDSRLSNREATVGSVSFCPMICRV